MLWADSRARCYQILRSLLSLTRHKSHPYKAAIRICNPLVVYQEFSETLLGRFRLISTIDHLGYLRSDHHWTAMWLRIDERQRQRIMLRPAEARC
jgi:hypothetical protein